MNERNISLEQVFVYRALTELFYLEKSVNDPTNFEPDRLWLFNSDKTEIMEQIYLRQLKDGPDYVYRDNIIPHYKSSSTLYGKDTIEFYKLAVIKAVENHDKLEGTKNGRIKMFLVSL